jgi:hypothetical protein
MKKGFGGSKGSGYCAVLKSTAQSAVILGTAGIRRSKEPSVFVFFFICFNTVTSVKQKLFVLFFFFFSLFHSQLLSDYGNISCLQNSTGSHGSLNKNINYTAMSKLVEPSSVLLIGSFPNPDTMIRRPMAEQVQYFWFPA